jgi:hypothetical protein
MSADLSDAQIQASAPALALLPVANALLTRIDQHTKTSATPTPRLTGLLNH